MSNNGYNPGGSNPVPPQNQPNGYPLQNGQAPQVPPQGYANPAMPPQGYPNRAVPPQGYPNGAMPRQGYQTPVMPPQGYANPAMPPQGYAAPRPAAKSGSGLRFLGLPLMFFGTLFLLIGLLAFGGFGRKSADATITYIRDYSDGHVVNVSFTTEDHRFITGELNEYRSTFEVGQTVPVKYKPDDPQDFVSGSYLGLGMFCGFGTVFLAGGIAIFVILSPKKKKEPAPQAAA